MFKYTFIPDHHRHQKLVAFNGDFFFLFSRSWSFARLCVYWLWQFLEIHGPHAVGSVSVLTELYIWSAVSILAVMLLLNQAKPERPHNLNTITAHKSKHLFFPRIERRPDSL